MNPRVRIPTLTILVCAALLCACASKPPGPATPAATATAATTPATEENRPPPPPGQRRYKWTKASEAEVSAQLEKKFQEAAKSFVKLKRDEQVMFCKKYREIGSTIRTLHCITEAELRRQVEDSDELRQQMRNKMGHCDITSGCQAGG